MEQNGKRILRTSDSFSACEIVGRMAGCDFEGKRVTLMLLTEQIKRRNDSYGNCDVCQCRKLIPEIPGV